MRNARGENVASSRDRENFATFAPIDRKLKAEALEDRDSRWRPFSFGSPTDYPAMSVARLLHPYHQTLISGSCTSASGQEATSTSMCRRYGKPPTPISAMYSS